MFSVFAVVPSLSLATILPVVAAVSRRLLRLPLTHRRSLLNNNQQSTTANKTSKNSTTPSPSPPPSARRATGRARERGFKCEKCEWGTECEPASTPNGEHFAGWHFQPKAKGKVPMAQFLLGCPVLQISQNASVSCHYSVKHKRAQDPAPWRVVAAVALTHSSNSSSSSSRRRLRRLFPP